ncbi:hypothetical protein A3A39_04770 [Candidatus Kaiserbacteria bacterium RIFCSPLOWO2_01_FULL_54_13]|uniref:Uncharacterized protein n=1 Tax=Candidatus Kaiserbacteria bacterium RIFCSPLOWO2_01_FULL_54_13 TaxID=1798512 RepID=A0A1F6F0S1_9BACT|nr:MAG: hypothetical protein A3A39_04770 [Candidatus Kaiserbacteria bacterium RIFCSPLOWO2_01_FULL_54_13]
MNSSKLEIIKPHEIVKLGDLLMNYNEMIGATLVIASVDRRKLVHPREYSVTGDEDECFPEEEIGRILYSVHAVLFACGMPDTTLRASIKELGMTLGGVKALVQLAKESPRPSFDGQLPLIASGRLKWSGRKENATALCLIERGQEERRLVPTWLNPELAPYFGWPPHYWHLALKERRRVTYG